MSKYQKTLTERVFHAISFEIVAILITAPLSAWVLGRSIFQMGMIAVVLSSLAMILNLVYNIIFDRFWPLSKGSRPIKIRIIHAIGFELSFIVIGVPILAILLSMTLWNAFVLEMGFFIFFLFYTYAFNLGYDKLREKWFTRRDNMKKQSAIRN